MKFLVITLFFIGTSAQAHPLLDVTVDKPVCFARAYSGPHMQSHPAQTVRLLTLKFSRNPYNPSTMLSLNIYAVLKRTTTDEKGEERTINRPYTNLMICDLAGNQLNCGVECDGGRATVSWSLEKNAKNEITFVNHGFVLHGGCGEDMKEGDEVFLTPTPGGDDVFTLFQHPEDHCE